MVIDGRMRAPADEEIGVHFTPREWVEWLLERMKVADAWLSGSTVLDPTCGDGRFLLALLRSARARGIGPEHLPVRRLFGIERVGAFRSVFLRSVREEFGIEFPEKNFVTADFLFGDAHPPADILVGNPPWKNFVDLPEGYKERLKPLFFEYGLIGRKRALLLGGSRIDIAALVVARAMREYLRPDGKAYFFLPLSLFFNEGAHQAFRHFDAGGSEFALETLYDFGKTRIFPGIATRYGIACFRRDVRTTYPVPYYDLAGRKWLPRWAAPSGDIGSALSVRVRRHGRGTVPALRMPLDAESKPRQGVNTCGANGTLIFSDYRQMPGGFALVSCGDIGEVMLPSKYLYPLIDRAHFGAGRLQPSRFVLLPYDEKSGKPLTGEEITKEETLSTFLRRAARRLKRRRGTLIGQWIRHGEWWASLGVGSYAFAPFKVVWRSYGATEFRPRIFGAFDGKPWQANQALHAYIPCRSHSQARILRARLMRADVKRFLESFRMGGTRSWAQPGRMSMLFDFTARMSKAGRPARIR